MRHPHARMAARRPWTTHATLLGAVLLFAGGISVVVAAPAGASTSTQVTCSGTPNTLQSAIDTASPGETIDVSGTCDGTFTVSTNLTIKGPATLDGNESSFAASVITVSAGVTVALENLTIQGGFAGFGGGIDNDAGTITLDNSSVTGNTGAFGGGIYSYGSGATVTLDNSTVKGNTAEAGGGGIVNLTGTITLNDSSVKGNTAYDFGGGIDNDAGTITLDNSTVQDNTAGGYGGGGIYNEYATLTVDNSTVQDNTTGGNGGGIASYLSTVTLGGSSVHDNTAGGDGGGIYNVFGGPNTVTLNDSVVKHNSPDDLVNCAYSSGSC